MITIDPGHLFLLDALDGRSEQYLCFVKREGDKYPGNQGHYPGTNCQEVLRALIEHIKYVDRQQPHIANKRVLFHLRNCIRLLEERAASRHGRTPERAMYVPDQHWKVSEEIEYLVTCPRCGHIGCKENRRGLLPC